MGEPLALLYTFHMFLIEVSRAFQAAGVEFALAGGHAVAFHGAPRGTFDLDFVLLRDVENYQRAFEALKGLGLKSSIPVSVSEVFDNLDSYIRDRNLLAWNFVNPSNPIQSVDLLIFKDLSKLEFEKEVVGGVFVPILTRESLVSMKKESGRSQDIEDVRVLESIKSKS